MTTIPPFGSPRERTIWVQATLLLLNTNFSKIGREHGWSGNAVALAMYRPSDPQEKAIADALGVSQRELFPERYDEDGNRLHLVHKMSPHRKRRNVKQQDAA